MAEVDTAAAGPVDFRRNLLAAPDVHNHIVQFYEDDTLLVDVVADFCLARNETLQGYEARLKAKDGSIRHVVINSNVSGVCLLEMNRFPASPACGS